MLLLKLLHVSLLIGLSYFPVMGEEANSESPIIKELTEEIWDDIIGQDIHILVNFHSPSCPHCIRFSEVWEALVSQHNKMDSSVFLLKVDCEKSRRLCAQEGITGLPTVKLYRAGSSTGVEYAGVRDVESINNYIHMQLGDDVVERESIVKSPYKIPDEKNGLIELTDDTIDDALTGSEQASSGHYFVMFHVHWCSHCQALAPIFAQLAQSYKYDRSVKIAQIDCTPNEKSCKQYGVKAYPTLYYFIDGHLVGKYDGERSLNDLKSFVESMKKRHQDTEDDHPLFPKIADTDEEYMNALRKLSEDDAVMDEIDAALRMGRDMFRRKFPTLDFDDPKLRKTLKQHRANEKEGEFWRKATEILRQIERDQYLKLTESTFKPLVQDDITLVAYTVPWCKRSRALIPKISDLGTKLIDINWKSDIKKQIKVGVINCSDYEKFCDRHSIVGYPTLHLYADGEFQEEYPAKSSTDPDDILDWLLLRVIILTNHFQDGDARDPKDEL